MSPDLNSDTSIESSRLKIKYYPDFSLKFSSGIETWIHLEWEEKLLEAKKNKILLFNGSLFHVLEVNEKNNQISIILGNTDYRTYVCSRTSKFNSEFPETVSAKPLAVCVSLVTSDNFLLIEKRRGVDVHEGMYHVVGGFMDPLKDIGNSGNPDPFSSIIREVKEETNLDVNRRQLIYLGMAEDTTVPHFELCFYAKLDIDSVQVKSILKNSINDGEFNEPIFIDLSEGIVNFLSLNENSISPTGKVCIELMASKYL